MALYRSPDVFLWFDLVTYFLTHDPDSNLTWKSSRQSFWQNCRNKDCLWFDLMTLFLSPHDPDWNLSKQSSWQSFCKSFKRFRIRIWPLECKQGFSLICSSDLLFNPNWPRFELYRDFIKAIIMSKFDKDWVNIVTLRVQTWFFYDLT